MADEKLPNGRIIYVLALLSCVLSCFGGIALIFAVTSFVLAKKSENSYNKNPEGYTNIGLIKKGKVIAIIGIVLNLIVVGITIWTLSTIGWDAWSEEFVRKWNEGLENGGG